MRTKSCLILLSMAFLCLSLLWQENGYSQSIEENYKLEQGIVYGSTKIGPLTMNIATPMGGGPFACIIYVGWGGVASWNTSAAINATEKGYIGVVIDYQRNAKYPVPVADLKCALGWIASNGAKYMIDSKRIALVGFSFGAYLTLMSVYTTEAEIPTAQCENRNQDYKVKAVVSLGAPTDWSKLSDPTYYGTLRGGERKEDFFAKASPLAYVDSKDPPTMILHGEIDKQVAPINAELLDEKLAQKGVPHKYILLKDQDGHIMEQWHSEVVWEFIEKYLK